MFKLLLDWSYRLIVDRLAQRIANEITEATGEQVYPPSKLLLRNEPEVEKLMKQGRQAGKK